MNIAHLLSGIPPNLVYLVAALAVGVESMGIPVPGETVLATCALLSAHHDLAVSPWGVAIAGSIGAITGDSIGYAVGRRHGHRLLTALGRRFPRHCSPAHVGYAQEVFRRRGVYAVFFGRFVALLRIFAGPLAGTLHMPYPRFLAANALGGIIWASGTTFLVYSLGVAAEHWLSRAAWVGLLGAAILAVLLSRVVARHVERNVRAFAERNGLPAPPHGRHGAKVS